MSFRGFICTAMLIALHVKSVVSLVPESELFPFKVSDGSSIFRFNDDDVLEVPLTLPFNFFNKTYRSTFISGNGQLSFGTGVRAYTPECKSSSVPMIMAFWADADERLDLAGSQLLYRQTTNRALLQKASKDVFTAFPKLQGITLSWMFILTWKDVPYFGATTNPACKGLSKRNTYQLILTTDGIHSFALFYYNKITWTTGTSSGGSCYGTDGSPAKAGFDYGDNVTLYTIPGSCTPSILDIPKTSNINQPGKWVFRIDSNLDTVSCEKFDENKQSLRFKPPLVSIIGNTPLLVYGPCLEESANVTCKFWDSSQPLPLETKGNAYPWKSVTICPIPYLYSLGRIRVDLSVSYPNKLPTLYKGYLYVIKEQEIDNTPQVYINKTADGSLHMTAKWDSESLKMDEIEKLDKLSSKKDSKPEVTYEVDINVVEYDGKKWKDVGILSSSVKNTGHYEGTLDFNFAEELSKRTQPRAIAVKGKKKLRSGVVLEKLTTSRIIDGTEVLGAELQNMVTTNNDRKEKVKKEANKYDNLCKQWFEDEPNPPTDTLPCPRTVEQATVDSRYAIDRSPNLTHFHPGAVHAFMQSIPSASGAGCYCTYDSRGQLLVGPPGGGRLHRRSPNNRVDHWDHFWDDVVPFLYCCKWSAFRKRNCQKYFYKKRPSDDGSRYAPPRPTRATGDPHITTFDGLTYTFNAVGEFWMVRYVEAKNEVENPTSFKMQARMEQYISVEGKPFNASVFTAAVMEQSRNGSTTKVQVSYSSERIFVLVDDEPVNIFEETGNNATSDDEDPGLNLENGFTLYHDDSTILLKSPDEVVVTFSSGFSFTFSTSGPNEVALNIFGSVSPHLINQTVGLMGNFDEQIDNDFITPNGTILSVNSTMEDIHYKFGMHWIVSRNETVFSYPPGKSYIDFCQPEFKPVFISLESISTVSPSVVDFCSNVTDCIFDYLATGSDSIAKATKSSYIAFEKVIQVAIHEMELRQCDPPFEPGNGYITGNSYLLGSAIAVECESEYTLFDFDVRSNASFTCVEEDGDLKWSSLDSDEPAQMQLLTCLTQEDLRDVQLSNLLWIGLSVLFAVICLIVLITVVGCKFCCKPRYRVVSQSASK